MTETEILPQQVLRNGTYFTAHVSYNHLPGATIPTAGDINAELNAVNAGITCDSVTLENGTLLIGALTVPGINVLTALNCHIDDIEEDPQGGSLQNWIVAAFGKLSDQFSIHLFVVTQLVTVSESPGFLSDIGDVLNKLPTGPFAAMGVLGLAVIAIVIFVAWNEVRHNV